MIVELKSLLPPPEAAPPETVSLLRETASARDKTAQVWEHSAEEGLPPGNPELPPPPLPGESAESTLPVLLEQLIRCSEKNAESTEKIADLLESRESSALPVYN